MTLVQLEYVIALDTWKHFAKAAIIETLPPQMEQKKKVEMNIPL